MSSKELINGVLIPSVLLLVGTAIVKIEWMPFAVALVGILGAWKVFNTGELWHEEEISTMEE
jgi:cytochrome-b5 reductase